MWLLWLMAAENAIIVKLAFKLKTSGSIEKHSKESWPYVALVCWKTQVTLEKLGWDGLTSTGFQKSLLCYIAEFYTW